MLSHPQGNTGRGLVHPAAAGWILCLHQQVCTQTLRLLKQGHAMGVVPHTTEPQLLASLVHAPALLYALLPSNTATCPFLCKYALFLGSLAPWLLPSLPAGGPAPEPRRDAAAAVYSSGPTDYLAVFGGTTADSTHLNDMWLFSLTQRTWTLVPIVVRMSLVRHCFLRQGVQSRPKSQEYYVGCPACTVLHCTALHACLQLDSFALRRLACRVLPTSHMPAGELP